MSVTLIGMGRLNAQLRRVPDMIDDEVSTALSDFASKTVVRARSRHRFTSRSGMLAQSVQSRQRRFRSGHMLKIFLNSRFTTTASGSYGVFQHNGTRYIQPDPFLRNAVKHNLPRLKRALRRIPSRVSRRL